MIRVDMPQDIDKIKTKFMFNLTKRQCIGFAIAALFSFPAYYLTSEFIEPSYAIYALVIVAFPVLFLTFFEKNGMYAEEYFKYIYLHSYYQPKIREKKFISKKVKKIKKKS